MEMEFSHMDRRKVAAAPLLGQDTDSILSKILGLSRAELERLHANGIIGGPTP